MGNTCHPASCCGGGGAFEEEQNTIERPLSTEGSIQENGRKGRYINTEEERRSNDTRDADGRGGNTLINEEEERTGNYNLEMPDPTQTAYENEGSFEGIEKEECGNNEKKKGVFSAKSLVPEWEEEEEEFKEKKREDYVQEGMRDLEEINSLYKEKNCRMAGEKEKRRENYEEEEKRHKLKINNIIDGRMYKENKLYEIEDRTCSQGNKLYEMGELIYSEESQNYLSISPYQNHFSPDMQRKEYWITEEPLAIRTEDIGLFWNHLLTNPYDKAEETETEEEDEEIQLSMNPFPKYQDNDNTFTTTTTSAVSTATSPAGLHGAPAAREVHNVSLGKSVSVDRDGIAIEAFGFKATIGINPSITFFGHSLSLQRLLSGPDNPREGEAS
ncbi:uncharacterized protein LOC123513191 [Portunus trituberculatus]|uniref:Uncharacterized protein n=1 Tax=Portunus trituberculatus TaxID=210409 RepID=A0A5B7ENF0_PORTR|nr:uncharacterized protein LOC123513191 [Portunus trituberculatus]XP_045126106.1 uncharacterized protein LOC123513191 [Portunus trituberculatus]XP_045126107.1 uncharacterized protein LOC123513191 [Portunus trituberculatus]MPC35981.1 hypothetical protein [Portunus trituberculatus]